MSPPAKKAKTTFTKPKNNYNGKRQFLKAGYRGFFVTCNFREIECLKECQFLLKDYLRKLNKTKNNNSIQKHVSGETITESAADKDGDAPGLAETDETSSQESDTDVADALSDQLVADSPCQRNKAHFIPVDTGTTNTIFIRATNVNPTELGIYIIEDIAKKKIQRTRFVLRFLPIEVVCNANIASIRGASQFLIRDNFAGKDNTFAIVFNKRYNNSIKREEVIDELAKLVESTNPNCRVDLRNAKKTVVVEIIKGLCCISVLDNYLEYKKYNLNELANAPEKTPPEVIKNDEKPENTTACTNDKSDDIKESVAEGHSDEEKFDNAKAPDNTLSDKNVEADTEL